VTDHDGLATVRIGNTSALSPSNQKTGELLRVTNATFALAASKRLAAQHD
jgi:hypothetical protein